MILSDCYAGAKAMAARLCGGVYLDQRLFEFVNQCITWFWQRRLHIDGNEQQGNSADYFRRESFHLITIRLIASEKCGEIEFFDFFMKIKL
jgi:hypothetical protein